MKSRTRAASVVVAAVALAVSGCSSGPTEYDSAAEMISAMSDSGYPCPQPDQSVDNTDWVNAAKRLPSAGGVVVFTCAPPTNEDSGDFTSEGVTVLLAPAGQNAPVNFFCDDIKEGLTVRAQTADTQNPAVIEAEVATPLIVGANWVITPNFPGNSWPLELNVKEFSDKMGAENTQTAESQCGVVADLNQYK